eukprot:320368-Rhodomonas_salina.3
MIRTQYAMSGTNIGDASGFAAAGGVCGGVYSDPRRRVPAARPVRAVRAGQFKPNTPSQKPIPQIVNPKPLTRNPKFSTMRARGLR